MNIDQIKQVPWEVDPTPVRVVGTTFGNELQSKINNRMLVNNVLLLYLCTFFTVRYFFYGY